MNDRLLLFVLQSAHSQRQLGNFHSFLILNQIMNLFYFVLLLLYILFSKLIMKNLYTRILRTHRIFMIQTVFSSQKKKQKKRSEPEAASLCIIVKFQRYFFTER